MVEVDVVLRGGDGEPILAHPPDTDSDITLQEWLAQMGSTSKGIKLDFKSLAAVGPSLELLGQAGQGLDAPVWLNGDILPGPRGGCAPLDARAFLGAVTSSCPEATLSLGWTTGCHRGQGYEWPLVQEMWRLCHPLSQPVTFAVRAALVPGSVPQLQWLLQQCHRSVLLPACPSAAGLAGPAQCQPLARPEQPCVTHSPLALEIILLPVLPFPQASKPFSPQTEVATINFCKVVKSHNLIFHYLL
ncbi:protein FAM151B isoform X3 [Passer montanus]|nr:protein FAM151B isoform X3 [Passer montanus]